MPRLQVQVSIERRLGLPEDRIVNTFAIGTTALQFADPSTLGAIGAAMFDFYNGGGTKIVDFMSALVKPGADHTIKIYNLDTPQPRPPIFTSSLQLTGATGSAFPAEVAYCLSFRSNQAGVPLGRQRGRVYLGPLDTGATQEQLSGPDVRPWPAFQNAVLDAGERLMNNAAFQWSVWSRVTGTFYEVVEVSADNAMDTQRRRGADPTLRLRRLQAP